MLSKKFHALKYVHAKQRPTRNTYRASQYLTARPWLLRYKDFLQMRRNAAPNNNWIKYLALSIIIFHSHVSASVSAILFYDLSFWLLFQRATIIIAQKLLFDFSLVVLLLQAQYFSQKFQVRALLSAQRPRILYVFPPHNIIYYMLWSLQNNSIYWRGYCGKSLRPLALVWWTTHVPRNLLDILL